MRELWITWNTCHWRVLALQYYSLLQSWTQYVIHCIPEVKLFCSSRPGAVFFCCNVMRCTIGDTYKCIGRNWLISMSSMFNQHPHCLRCFNVQKKSEDTLPRGAFKWRTVNSQDTRQGVDIWIKRNMVVLHMCPTVRKKELKKGW